MLIAMLDRDRLGKKMLVISGRYACLYASFGVTEWASVLTTRQRGRSRLGLACDNLFSFQGYDTELSENMKKLSLSFGVPASH